MVLLKKKKTKKDYHEMNCIKCKSVMAENKTGVCFECRTMVCECGRRFEKELHKYKPPNKCSVCRRGKRPPTSATTRDVETFLEPGLNGAYEAFQK